MKRMTIAAGLLAALLVSAAALAGAAAGTDAPGQEKRTGETTIQLLTVSDWHGQLEPIDVDPGPTTVLGGGAAYLKTYFDQARAANPNTLLFMAGDSFGASPSISNFFEEEPAVHGMNLMGVDADTLGNHNFDRGIDHLQRMVDLAEFPFVSANLKGVEENLDDVPKRVFFNVDGVRVAVIGITNEEAPELVFPGSFGTIEVTDSVEAADKAARQARAAGAQLVVILTHKGIRGRDTSGNAFGELIDFANEVDGNLIDVIVGDHTNFSYTGFHQAGKILAVENLSKGAQFSKIQVKVDRANGVIEKTVTQHTPFIAGVTPDAEIQAFIADLNSQLAPILGTVIGSSTVPVLRSDSCGRADSRLCESLVGNVVTDSLRAAYGSDLAITNSGGLRDALTCPHVESGGFCPTGVTTPPFPITRGGTIAVLRFGNVSTTTTLTGTEVKAFLEHGVSAMPGANGRFPQVSGLCFTYNIEAAVGSRVTSIVRQAADGTCTGPAIVADATNYTVASNDFTLSGGDGYPNVISKSTTRNIMDQDLAAYVTANSPISPTIQGRIVCTDPTPGSGNNCPEAITTP